MKVALVTRRYWPALGGVERVALELSRALAAEHEVSVVAQRIDDGPYLRLTHIVQEAPIFTPFERDGVSVRQFRPSRRRRALLLPFVLERLPLGGRLGMSRLRVAMARYYAAVVGPALAPLLAGADVVHVLGGEMLAAGAVRVARQLRLPVVVSPFAHPGEWGDDPASAWAYRNADAVVAGLEADAATYRELGVSSERVHVCGLATAPPPDDLPDREQLVLYLGSRRPNKGYDLVLEAARRLPHARFAFVGPGAPFDDPPPNVVDVGTVDEHERLAWLARASALCLLSSSETFGLVVTEAWSLGVPVIVSDIPVLRELVAGSGGGIVVPRSADAAAAGIARLLDDPQAARAMGEAGRRRWLSDYTPAAVARRHTELYEAISSSYAAASRAAAASRP